MFVISFVTGGRSAAVAGGRSNEWIANGNTEWLSCRYATAIAEAGYRATMRAMKEAPWQGEFDPIEGAILQESMSDPAAAAE
jgi:hypothetical protein